MVFRVEKSKNYTVMSNYHLREREMSLKAKGLLSWMLSNVDDWDYSIAGIVANCKENETAITSALKELKDFGYLTITREQSENGRFEWIYRIYEQPVKPQEGDLPYLDFPPMEKPSMENPVQRNTKQTNTNKINNTKVLGIGKPIPDSSETEPMQSLTEFQMHGYSEEDLKREMKEHRTSVRRERVEDEKPKKKSLYVQCMEELDKRPNFTVEEKEALKLYLPVRLALKDKPLVGVNMWKGLLNSLDKMHGDRVRIIEYSTARGYAAFFEDGGKSKYYTKKGDVNGKVDPSVFGETEKHQQIAKKATLKDRQEVFASGVQF